MKWLSPHIGGQRYRVDIVRRKHPELRGSDGVADHDRCRIYIAREQDEQAREDTFLHEALHAVMRVSGAYRLLLEALEDDDRTHEVEEQIVGALTPTLHRLLKDLGFRFPKGPNE